MTRPGLCVCGVKKTAICSHCGHRCRCGQRVCRARDLDGLAKNPRYTRRFALHVGKMSPSPATNKVKEGLNKSWRRIHLRTRAVCGVANPRNNNSYCYGLRLAAHPDPQPMLSTRFIQNFLNNRNKLLE